MVVPVNKLSGETGLLQLVQPVPAQLARDAETVQAHVPGLPGAVACRGRA